MAETQCPNCGTTLESEDEICNTCDAVVQDKSPSKLAPPPPAKISPPAEPRPRTVGDIMVRKVATLFEGESLEEAEKGFRKVRFRHVPVVGSDGFLIGLLSLRHLLRALPSPFDPASEARRAEIMSKYRIGDIMDRNVKTVSPEMPLEEAGTLIIDEKRDCLPVVDEKGNLIGLVTASDFVRLAIEFLRDAGTDSH